MEVVEQQKENDEVTVKCYVRPSSEALSRTSTVYAAAIHDAGELA